MKSKGKTLKYYYFCLKKQFKKKLVKISLIVLGGGLVADVLILIIQDAFNELFRLIGTIILFFAIIEIFVFATYDFMKTISNLNICYIIHQSPISFKLSELDPIIEKTPFHQKIHFNTIPYRNGEHTLWIDGKKDQEKTFNSNLNIKISSFSEIHYIGIAEIPFAIHLGYLVGDGIRIKFYQRQRNLETNQNPWIWPLKEKPLNWSVNVKKSRKKFKNKEICLLIEQSYSISDSDIKASVPDEYISIKISVSKPDLNDLQSEEQVKTIGNKVKKVLNEAKDAKKIHIFAAVPTSTAFIIGQCINKSSHSEISIYCYKQTRIPPYKKVFSLNESKNRI